MAEGEAKRGRRQVDSFRLRLTARTRRAWRAAAGARATWRAWVWGRRREGAEERSGAPRGAAVSPALRRWSSRGCGLGRAAAARAGETDALESARRVLTGFHLPTAPAKPSESGTGIVRFDPKPVGTGGIQN